mgnify:CR=1 FL=1
MHAERVNPADDQIRAIERLGQILNIIWRHPAGQLPAQTRVITAVHTRADDLRVQMRTDETHFVTVIGQGPGNRRAHQAGPEDSYD